MTVGFRTVGASNGRMLVAVLTFAVSATAIGAARADVAPEPAPQVRASAVEWNDAWPRFRVWEYAATGATWTGALLLRFAGPPLNRQRGLFWLDEEIVEAVSLSGTAADVAEGISDVGFMGSMVYRLLDSTVTPGLVWNDADVMLQMTLIDLSSFALSAIVLWSAQLAYGRERPGYRACPESAPHFVDCDHQGDDRYRSFIAGHTLIATTAAGLTCAHHRHLPLYGGGTADDAACGGTIALAALVGITRVVRQAHYPTDALLAWGLGVLAGYVLPSVLHYGFSRPAELPRAARRAQASGALRMAVIPGAATSPAGATLAGTF